MKDGVLLMLAVLLFGVARVNAAGPTPPQDTNAPTNLPSLQYDLLDNTSGMFVTPSVEKKLLTRHLELGGPLVQPLKAKRFSEALKRFVQLFNPFAPAEPVRLITRVEGTSSRSWTETVGTTPGLFSAFPDERTDVPTLTLISASPRRE